MQVKFLSSSLTIQPFYTWNSLYYRVNEAKLPQSDYQRLNKWVIRHKTSWNWGKYFKKHHLNTDGVLLYCFLPRFTNQQELTQFLSLLENEVKNDFVKISEI